MELPVLSEVIIQWRKTALAATAMVPPPLMMKIGATELEAGEFHLWKLRVLSDIEKFVSWSKMMRDQESQNYYKKVQYNVMRAAECLSAAHSLLDPSHKNCRVTLTAATDEQSFMKQVAELKKHLVVTHVLPGPESVLTLCILNWAAMSLFNAKMIKVQHGVLAAAISIDGGGNSAGLVLLPTFTYRKGQLHKASAEAQSAIASHGVNMDRQVALHFSHRQDIRVERPLLITASLVLAADDDCKHNRLVKGINNSPVICLGDQPRTKDLVVIDDPDIDALPLTINEETHATQVEKHNQIGHQACAKILSKFLDDLTSNDTRYAVLVLDLSVHVGDMIKAAINGAYGRPMMCVGLCNTGEKLDFAKSEIIHFIKAKLLTDDGFTIPGFTIPPKDKPVDAISVPTPALTALLWHGDTLVIKDLDRDKWKLHEHFQDAFDELDSQVQQTHPFQDALDKVPVKCEGDGDGEPPLKKLKGPEEQKAPQRFIDAATIQTEILQDVSLFETYPGGGPKKTQSQLALRVCSNSTLYLVNMAADSDKDAKDATIAHGSILVGYGKGKWQQNGTCDAKELKYELHNSSQAVIFNSNLTTVGTLVCAKRLTAEADVARCCYHEMIESPCEDDKCAFNLRSNQEIFYVVSDVAVKRESNGAAPQAIQANAASLLPPEQWNTDFTTLHWVVRWQNNKGLQPVRPQITWTGPSTAIPVGQALQLTP